MADKQVGQFRALYEAMGALKQYEQTVLAEGHAQDPSLLGHRFEKDVQSFAGVDLRAEAFHDRGAEPPVEFPEQPAIKATIDLANRLRAAGDIGVEGAPSLGFRYVDRELFPARTTEKEGRSRARRLDLLLANSEDGTPIIGEVKIGEDELPYYALVQLLMHAVELASAAQRGRLADHYPDSGFPAAEGGLPLDLYTVALRRPSSPYRDRSLEATRTISERLVKDPRISPYVRRIVFLDAVEQGDELVFRPTFAF